jgi:hypothetical protein
MEQATKRPSVDAENIQKARSCIGLLNSMIRSGESHSDTSCRMLVEALDALDYLEQHNAGVSSSGGEPEYAPRECSELQGFPRTEVIQCPQCSKTQSAQVHFERWMPFPVYVHDCECGYTITESDWDVVPNASLTLSGKENSKHE